MLTAASKASNLAGLEAAQLVTAPDRTRAAADRLTALGEQVGLLGILAAEVAYAECDLWLDAVICQLHINRSLLTTLLSDQLPEIRWTPPLADFLTWLDCRRMAVGDDAARLTSDVVSTRTEPPVGPGSRLAHVRSEHES